MTCSQSQDHSPQEKTVGSLIPVQVDALRPPALAHFAGLGKLYLGRGQQQPTGSLVSGATGPEDDPTHRTCDVEATECRTPLRAVLSLETEASDL